MDVGVLCAQLSVVDSKKVVVVCYCMVMVARSYKPHAATSRGWGVVQVGVLPPSNASYGHPYIAVTNTVLATLL